jgi:hypothetical protein
MEQATFSERYARSGLFAIIGHATGLDVGLGLGQAGIDDPALGESLEFVHFR